MKAHIAVDIGGTHMRAASYTFGSLKPIRKNRIQSQVAGVKTQDRLIKLIKSVWPGKEKVEGIGIALPGPVDPSSGVIIKTPNIPDFNNFSMVNFIEVNFNSPVFLGNDANLAALGEWKFGAGQGCQDLIYFTISTGIGSGIISGGTLLLGANGLGAELGHVTIIPGGPVCSCGKKGHLEAFSSGTAIANWVGEEIEKGKTSSLQNIDLITARIVAEAANQGDLLSIEAFNRAGNILGIAIVNFLHIFNPTLIIFGGGVSASLNLLLPQIQKALDTEIFAPGYCDNLNLTPAILGDDAGLLGALVLARGAEASL